MAEKKAKKKDSKLSIAAAVTALFIFTIPIGFILAIVDLIKSKGDKSQRHLGSYFAIVSFALFLIVAFSNGSSNSSNNAVVAAMSEANNNVNITLQGDADKLFAMVQDKANNYTNMTGQAAFPY